MQLSIVIPAFDEEEVFPALIARVTDALCGLHWELIFVDDGCRDTSAAVIGRCASGNDRIKLLRFSRNSGHQAAITAGVDFAQGDAVVVMDADLQDPPELLPKMVELYEQGFGTAFKIWTARMFYRLMGRPAGGHLSVEVGDCRLFSHKAVLAVRPMREQHRFMRGICGWLGLPEALLPFERSHEPPGKPSIHC
jgi:glycosyltransferase involved in cell wall biosynthesis